MYSHRSPLYIISGTVVSWNLKPWVYLQLNRLPHLQGGEIREVLVSPLPEMVKRPQLAEHSIRALKILSFLIVF